MSHRISDAVSLEIARRISHGLANHPEWIELAKSNLNRWSRLNSEAPGLLACYAQWRQILDQPVNDIAMRLVAETDEGQRLRQNSPFAGVLSAREIWQIKRRIHEATAA
ncbi:MAG TPA: hypothetical protein VG722_05365 [Tepidisphaeraceae bacterium]|nr:hypothetical protein [Tepidisphaeraceae bacterium]